MPRTAAILAFAALVFIVVALAATTCTQSTRSTGASAAFSTSASYNWRNLSTSENRFAYSENGQVISCIGVDVSEHQGPIDWDAVAADGISLAMIRVGNRGATTGELYVDDYFAYNLDAATRVGLSIGVYFFSQATTEQEAIEEADFVLRLLDGIALDYPIAYDHERIAGVSGRADNLTTEQMSANAEAFCRRVEQAGYAAMLYGNASDLARYSSRVTQGRGIWFAEYGTDTPRLTQGFIMWQYTNEGTVAGIDTAVDLNICFKKP